MAEPASPKTSAAASDYYRQNAEPFFSATVQVDMTPLHERFLATLPAGARILDAGCGSGRDAKAFAERGHAVAAFDASPELARLAADGVIEWIARAYQSGDLQGARLIIAATNVRAVNHAVAMEAHEGGQLVNVADAPAEGNVHMPAVHRDENVIVAVNSLTARPRIAVLIRDWVAGLLPGYQW